jgi:hypothetical protein
MIVKRAGVHIGAVGQAKYAGAEDGWPVHAFYYFIDWVG